MDFPLPRLALTACGSSVFIMSFSFLGCSANIAVWLPYGVGNFQGSVVNTRRQVEQMFSFFFYKHFWFKHYDKFLQCAGEREWHSLVLKALVLKAEPYYMIARCKQLVRIDSEFILWLV